MKVRQMTGRTGQPVKNQFIIETDQATYFQSYQTVIAKRCKQTGQVTLDRSMWDYSVTTGKYRNKFVGSNTDETRRQIKSGVIALEDLNNA